MAVKKKKKKDDKISPHTRQKFSGTRLCVMVHQSGNISHKMEIINIVTPRVKLMPHWCTMTFSFLL